MTDRDQLIISNMSKTKMKTINEVIDTIYEKDVRAQVNRGWKFYVHLNKRWAPMSRDGRIVDTGNVNAAGEKLWLRA